MSNALKKGSVFSTSDLYLSATLYALGFSPASIDRKNKNRMAFVFLDTDDLMITASHYWCRKLKIEPQQLFAALKALKSRLHEDAL